MHEFKRDCVLEQELVPEVLTRWKVKDADSRLGEGMRNFKSYDLPLS
jgi:hypothetical protein